MSLTNDPSADILLGPLACAAPFLICIAGGSLALAAGSDLSEAVFAGAMAGACPAFALAAVTSTQRRSPGRRAAVYVLAALASLLLGACYSYARVAGYTTTDIRVGMSVILFALLSAALVTVCMNMARVRRDLRTEQPRVR